MKKLSIIVLSLLMTLVLFNGNVNAATWSVGVPPGNNTEVPFNDGGQWGTDTAFVYNKATDTLTVTKLGSTSMTFDSNTETLSGSKTLVITDSIIQRLDPNGSDRDVTLPSEATSTDLVFYIYNTANGAGEDLTVKDDTPATVVTLGPGMGMMFTCNGTSWVAVGEDGIVYDAVANTHNLGSSAVTTTGAVTAGSVVTDEITAPGASLVIKPTTDATTAIQIQDKDGTATLTVDSTNNRVGIGATPASKLDVEGSVAIGATYSGTTAAPTNGMIVEGNVGLGQTTFGTSAAKTLAIGNGTAPTTSPADATQLWSQDHNSAAGYARLYQRTEDGLSGPVAQLAEVTQSVNPKAMAQGVNLTAASSGSTGITVADDDDIDFGTGDFFLSGMFKIPDWTPSADAILAQKTDGTNGWILQIDTTGVIQLTISSLATYSSTVAPSITDGTAHRIGVVATRETAAAAGSVAFYVDGKPVGASVAITAGAPVTVTNAVALYVLGTSAVRTAGTCYEFTPYNRALTAAEVKSLYENGVDYADKWGSQTNLASSNVTNVATDGYDTVDGISATGFHAVETTGNKGVVVTNPSFSAVTGYRYLVTFTATLTSGTAPTMAINRDADQVYTGSNIETITAGENTHILISMVDDTTSYIGFRNGNGEYAEYTIANIVVTRLGATLALESENIRADGWQDSSTNGLDASYPTTGYSFIRPQESIGLIYDTTNYGNIAVNSSGNITLDPSGSNVGIVGGQSVKKTNVSDAAYGTSALTSDYIVAFLTLTAARTATISTEDVQSGTATQPRVMKFKDQSGNAGSFPITIVLESGGTIDGATNYVIDQPYQAVEIWLDGTNGSIAP